MAVFVVFAVKYTYFKPQNILIEAKNILMISCTYEAKICRTTPEDLLGGGVHLRGRVGPRARVCGGPRHCRVHVLATVNTCDITIDLYTELLLVSY